MNLNEGRKAIGQAFSAPLFDLGFEQRKRLTYARSNRATDRVDLVAFSVRTTNDGDVCFSVGVGIRFEAIEQVLGRSGQQELFYTIGQPLHLFREDRRFTEWCINSSINSETIGEVITQIKRYALPFFDKFVYPGDIGKVLQSDRPGDWFTLSPKERQAMLSAIESLPADT